MNHVDILLSQALEYFDYWQQTCKEKGEARDGLRRAEAESDTPAISYFTDLLALLEDAAKHDIRMLERYIEAAEEVADKTPQHGLPWPLCAIPRIFDGVWERFGLGLSRTQHTHSTTNEHTQRTQLERESLNAPHRHPPPLEPSPLAGSSPFVLPKPAWDAHKEWHGKCRIMHTLQGSPVGRDEQGQKEYAVLLASWLTHEGPLPPPMASPESKECRDKQQAKKRDQVGVAECGERSRNASPSYDERDQRMQRVGELACRMHELVSTHGFAVMNSEEYSMYSSEQFALMAELPCCVRA